MAMAEAETLPAKTNGRPTDYTEELGILICEQIIQGKSLRSICSQEDMPSIPSVYLWISRHKEFSEHYARAKADQAEAMGEDTLEIADKSDGDVQRDKLRVDTRKWLMSKFAPKRYGDRVVQAHEGAVPVKVVIDKDDSGVL